jgi:hypothetical protein
VSVSVSVCLCVCVFVCVCVGGRDESFVGLLSGILLKELEPETTACMNGGTVSNAVLRMTELIFLGFSLHSIQQVCG